MTRVSEVCQIPVKTIGLPKQVSLTNKFKWDLGHQFKTYQLYIRAPHSSRTTDSGCQSLHTKDQKYPYRGCDKSSVHPIMFRLHPGNSFQYGSHGYWVVCPIFGMYNLLSLLTWCQRSRVLAVQCHILVVVRTLWIQEECIRACSFAAANIPVPSHIFQVTILHLKIEYPLIKFKESRSRVSGLIWTQQR